MPYRLIDRNKQVPNGMFFYEPRTKWKTRPWASFNQIVDDVIAHRNQNAWLGLPVDRPTVEFQVDSFIAEICARMGWNQYITQSDGSPPPPLPVRPPSLGSRLGNVAAGAEANVEWLKSGAEAVPKQVAEGRAAVCLRCEMNGKGGLERFFTVPLANAIRHAYAQRREWKLETAYDNQLGVCEACNCPLKLKVHFPINIVRSKLTDAAKAALWEQCWIRLEQ